MHSKANFEDNELRGSRSRKDLSNHYCIQRTLTIEAQPPIVEALPPMWPAQSRMGPPLTADIIDRIKKYIQEQGLSEDARSLHEMLKAAYTSRQVVSMHPATRRVVKAKHRWNERIAILRKLYIAHRRRLT